MVVKGLYSKPAGESMPSGVAEAEKVAREGDPWLTALRCSNDTATDEEC